VCAAVFVCKRPRGRLWGPCPACAVRVPMCTWNGKLTQSHTASAKWLNLGLLGHVLIFLQASSPVYTTGSWGRACLCTCAGVCADGAHGRAALPGLAVTVLCCFIPTSGRCKRAGARAGACRHLKARSLCPTAAHSMLTWLCVKTPRSDCYALIATL